MKRKQRVIGQRSQDFYMMPHHTEIDRYIYRMQFKAYLKEVDNMVAYAQSIQDSDLGG